jgi:hypothetical protein
MMNADNSGVLLNFADSIARVGQLVRSGVQQKQGAKGLISLSYGAHG